MADAEIRYTRDKPQEWDDLVGAIAPGDSEAARPFTFEAAKNALGIAADLETQRLEVATYYGLGLGMRGLAKALSDKTSRQAMAETIANNLDLEGKRMTKMIARPSAEAFNALTLASFNPITRYVTQSYLQMSPREHLACDALTIATRVRRSGAKPFETAQGADNNAHTLNVQRGDAAARLIASNATAGSIIVHNHMRAAAEAATELNLAAQKPHRFAVQSALLHTEEFQGELYQRAILYGADGSVLLDPNKIPDQPVLPEKRLTDIKHNGRLGCPAVQVQYAIPGMLELILDIERSQANT